ncbi:hypothetical protein [Vibrio phage VCPH]|nr:hypothetical protein [Vibrio phage VCPH]
MQTTIKEVLNEILSKIGTTPINAENSKYVPAPVYDQFCKNGKLDYARIASKYNLYIGTKDFNVAVLEVFGTNKFHTVLQESTITQEEFADFYIFGRFPQVRDWQRAVYDELGKYITLGDLFTWVQELG